MDLVKEMNQLKDRVKILEKACKIVKDDKAVPAADVASDTAVKVTTDAATVLNEIKKRSSSK